MTIAPAATAFLSRPAIEGLCEEALNRRAAEEAPSFGSTHRSTHSTPLQGVRLIVRRRALDVEVVRLALLVLQAEREVATVGEVHHQLERRPEVRQLVVVDDVAFLHAIELAAAIVAIHRED